MGQYTLDTHLESVATNCTSNTTAWTCAPYHTYDESPSRSKVIFNWIISPSAPGSPNNLSISSIPNPFSIQFSGAALALVDQGLQTERYTFSIPVDKIVVPKEAINAKCYYNGTTLEGELYTRLKQVSSDTSYTSTISSASPASTATPYSRGQKNWPYAVNITQFIGGGTEVPDCYRVQNGRQVERLAQGLEAKASTDTCSCLYKNTINT